MFRKCCGCIHLRTGALVIGTLDLIAGICCLNYVALSFRELLPVLFLENEGGILSLLESTMYFGVNGAIICFLAGGFLLHGAIKLSRHTLFVHLIFSMIGIGMKVVYLLTFIIQCSRLANRCSHFGQFSGIVMGGILVGASIKIYFWIIVYFFYKSLHNEESSPLLSRSNSETILLRPLTH